jgi:hypothetical protein
MITVDSHTHRSLDRTEEKPHFFMTPVVREIPRPAPEPPSWDSCW